MEKQESSWYKIILNDGEKVEIQFTDASTSETTCKEYKVIDLDEIKVKIRRGEDICLDNCYINNFCYNDSSDDRYSYVIHKFSAKNSFWDGEVNFHNAVFIDGTIDFSFAKFGDGNVDFTHVQFGNSCVDFSSTQFGDGNLIFSNAIFGNGHLSFNMAQFGNGKADFSFVNLKDGSVFFNLTQFGDGEVDFSHAHFGSATFLSAQFGHDNVDFTETQFGSVSFRTATFGGGKVDFSNVNFGKDKVDFSSVKFLGGDVNYSMAQFGDSDVDFIDAQFGDGNVDFSGAQFGGGDVRFLNAQFGNGIVDFSAARFGDGMIYLVHIKAMESKFYFRNQIITTHLYLSFYDLNKLVFENCTNHGVIEILENEDLKTHTQKPSNIIEMAFFNMCNLGTIRLDWDIHKKALIEFGKKRKCDDERKCEDLIKSKADEFKMLKENFSNQGEYDWEDSAYIQFKRHSRKLIKPMNAPIRKFLLWILDIVGKFGTAPLSIAWAMLFVVLLWGGMYSLFGSIYNNPANAAPKSPYFTYWAPFYYSVITFFTVGYGDLSAQNGITAILCGLESFLGVFLMSYFSVAVVRKILR